MHDRGRDVARQGRSDRSLARRKPCHRRLQDRRAPSPKAVHEGFAMQLGLLGLIAEHGGIEGVIGNPAGFEYWSLAKHRGTLGYVSRPTEGRNGIEPAEFTTVAARNFIAAATKWLTGN